MASESSSATTFRVMNQDFVKLDRFDGTNFNRWKDKMMFLLTALNVAYILDPKLSPVQDAAPDASDEEKARIAAQKKKREEDETVCRGHILNTLTDRLYDLYMSMKSPLEIWQSLEEKYNIERQGTDKFLMLKFYEFTMSENNPVMSQVHELLVLVSRLADLKVKIPESLQVGAIIAKLPSTWNDYRKKLLHMTEDFSVEKILRHLRIEEENKKRDAEYLGNRNSNGSKVNFIANNEKRKSQKRKMSDFKEKRDKKKTRLCYGCNQKGHYIKDCKKVRMENAKKGPSGSANANIVQEETNSFCAMVSSVASGIENIHIGMVTELHMATTKSLSWWLDSGATVHVCNNREQFKTYAETVDREVLMGNHNSAKVFGQGSVELRLTSGKKLTLLNVLHVPEIKKNLVSASLLCKNGFKVVLESGSVVLSKNGIFVGKGYSCEGMFKLNVDGINEMNNVSTYFVDSPSLWHARLAHLNFSSLQYMHKHGYLTVNGEIIKDKCEICIQAKITKKPFPKVERNTNILDLVHSDICELNGVLTRGGKRYFITFIDDCSRYTYVYLLRNKDEAFDMFKRYKMEVENQKERKIKVFRSDRGGEYFPSEFDEFCENEGIIHQRSAPYTPQQNGLAERKNRTLVDMVNSMILNARLPLNLWGEALLTACHVHNRIPSKKRKISPYEVWKGRKPKLDYLKVWGCLAFYRVPDPKRTKLGPRAIKSIFVGYAQNSKAFRLLDLNSNIIVETRDAEFIEHKFSSDHREVEHSSNGAITLSQQDIPESSSANKNKEITVEPRRSQRARKVKNLGSDFISSQAILFLIEGDRTSVLNKLPILLFVEDDPKSYGEAMASKDSAFWKEAINDEMDSILSNSTWVLVDLPPGSKPIKCKWVFRKKFNTDGSLQTFKARLVAKGFTQKEGIDYFDTYAPVARITSIRLLMALASIYDLYIHQMDVKTAFLNGDLDEEIYMEQPEGFVLPGNEKKVCKLIKSLYGLKQAPKQWHEKFDSVILADGFVHNNADKCIYSKFTKDYGVILCLYVDDLLIFGTNLQGISETKKYLTSCFKMKDMYEVDTILGIKVKRHSGGYALNQSHYKAKILEKFKHLGIKEANTPYDTSIKLVENTGRAVAQLEYASAIGSLMYAMHCTRPDIAYAVCKLSRFTSNPGILHWKGIARVLGYLKKTMSLGLFYGNYPAVLEGFSDASWITGAHDNKSTTGWIFTLGGAAISWASKKQTCISHSTMEAEFTALAAAGKEAEWLRNLLLDIHLWPQPMPPISLRCDSEATMSRAYSKVYNGKSRHISLRHEFVRQLIIDGIITISYVRSSNNLADPLTKGLSRDVVRGTTTRMGLKPFII